MNLKKYLSVALAAFAMLASCQKNDEKITETATKKSVSLTIANMAASAATRASQANFTGNGIPVATEADLVAYFAGEDGVVITSRALVAGTNVEQLRDADNAVIPGAWVFHLIPAEATQMAVTNVTLAVGADIDNVSFGALELEDWQDLDENPVWGRSSQWDYTEEEHEHNDGIIYNVYDAGDIEVEPMLARIEIGNISYTNIEGGRDFAALDIIKIGLHNTSHTTIDGDDVVYDFTTPDGVDEWDAASGWYVDGINTEVDAGSDDLAVWGYNVVPGTVPNIVLEVDLPTGTTPGTLMWPRYVRTYGLSDEDGLIDEVVAGAIYQVDFEFTADDADPWVVGEEICVNVTVEIPTWTIEPSLTPEFN
ncbi:MAG: hypothetical protein LBV38_03230 [Alistipes sp.]|jgi:hypothetical protein|nr:hypothetical protein [Alistipes sp.]